MLSLEKELSRILNNTTGERGVSRFLAKHPSIVRWAFCLTGGHRTYVVKEFPFGSHYLADFVVPLSYSGMWEVHMIELEPPNDKVINKDGTPSRRFNKAISQIHDWASYIEQNPYSFRQDLSDWCMKRDLLDSHNSAQQPCNFTGDYLHDMNTHIWFYYHVVIGRRDHITKEQRKKMNQFSRGFRVCTYGRFLDIARNFDKYKANPNEGVCMTATEEP
jgi:hypothetical protein